MRNKTKIETDPLIGKFFHSWTKDKRISWQGQVVARVPRKDLYLVRLFEWLAGSESSKELVPVKTMVGWSFYDSAKEMNWAYQQDHRKGV